MEGYVKKLILEDYKKAFNELDKIVLEEKFNRNVDDLGQYLSPSVTEKILPLNDVDGEFFHYNVICEVLENMLSGEKMDYFPQFRDANIEIKRNFNFSSSDNFE